MRLFCCFFTRTLPIASCLGFFLLPVTGVGQEELRQKDREAIIDSVGTYVDAFNARDVEALGSHWSKSGEWIDRETGNRVAGREAIRQQFADSFKTDERSRISVHVDSIRFVTRQVAIEEGVATIVGADGPEQSNYSAIHVLADDGWKIDSIRESSLPMPEPAVNAEQLQQLQWLVGDWVDGDAVSAIETSCQWAKNKSFLTRKFRVTSGDEVRMEGMQIIAWDPNAKTIRSWMFDSDGGFGEGIWKAQQGSWTVRFSQALPTGGTASSVNVYSHIQDDSFTFESIDRKVDGEAIDDVAPVQIVRQANDSQ